MGGFYKEVKNFTYYTQYTLHNSAPAGLDSVLSYSVRTNSGVIHPKDGARLYTYTNSPYTAYIRGLEVHSTPASGICPSRSMVSSSGRTIRT